MKIINQKEKALSHYDKALVLYEELKDSTLISTLNNNIGDLYLYDSSFKNANQSLEKSLLFAGDDKESKSLTYSTYGAYCLELSEFEIAKGYFEKAIQLLVFGSEYGDFTNPTIEQLSLKPNKLRLFDFIYQKAAYWKKRFIVKKNQAHLNQALADYKLADQLLDVIRFDSTEKTSKLFWREKGAKFVYESCRGLLFAW